MVLLWVLLFHGISTSEFLGPHLPPPHPSLNSFSPPITPHFITLLISFPSTVGPLSILSCSLSAERKGVSIKIHAFGGFPGGPVVRTQHSHCQTGFSPWLGTYDSTTCTEGPKNTNVHTPLLHFFPRVSAFSPSLQNMGNWSQRNASSRQSFRDSKSSSLPIAIIY